MVIHRRERPTIVNFDGKYHVFLTDTYGVKHWLEIAKGPEGVEIHYLPNSRYLSDTEADLTDMSPTNINKLRSPWHLENVTGNGNGDVLIGVKSQDLGYIEYILKITKNFLHVSPRKRSYLPETTPP